MHRGSHEFAGILLNNDWVKKLANYLFATVSPQFYSILKFICFRPAPAENLSLLAGT